MRFRAFSLAIACAGCCIAVSTLTSGCYINPGAQTPYPQVATPPGSLDPASPLDIDWMIVWVDGFAGDPTRVIPLPGLIMTSQGTRLVGNTSCNQFTGGHVIDVPARRIRFTSLHNERNFCQPVNSEADDAILRALVATDGFERHGDKLTFTSDGRDVIRLVAK
ncbi:MAG TPA: META domain-containing protein [Candidatus Limnocylindrales bacterium]|nr:META domain-containing protein [Candidatus Limnocylindrales bacterium]